VQTREINGLWREERLIGDKLEAFEAITPKDSPHAMLLRDAVAAGDVRAASALPRFEKWDLPIEEFLPKLGNELCSTNGAIHMEALHTIKRLNVREEVLVPYLGKAVTDPDPRFRAELLKELRSMGAAGIDAVPAVLLALDDPYSYVRVEAVRTLRVLRPDAHEDSDIVVKLKSKLTDPNEHVVETVRAAMESFGGSEGGAENARE
jgi:hypothetical protein